MATTVQLFIILYKLFLNDLMLLKLLLITQNFEYYSYCYLIFQGGKTREYDSVKYENEKDKPTTPSKEELELNERNISKPTRLGKLHFRLRYFFFFGSLWLEYLPKKLNMS